MRNFMVIALALFILSPLTALAEIRQDKPGMFAFSGCDTMDQLQEVVSNWQANGWPGLVASMNSRNSVRNSAGEPVCGIAAGPMTPLKSHGQFEAELEDGTGATIYVIELMREDGWRFFAVSIAPMVAGDPA